MPQALYLAVRQGEALLAERAFRTRRSILFAENHHQAAQDETIQSVAIEIWIMPVRFKAEGPLTRRNAAAFIGRAIRSIYEPLGNDLVNSLQNDLPGHYKKTVKKKVTGKSFDTKLTLYSNAAGIEAIEEGRKPGKAPPPDVLLKWVRKRGLGVKSFSIKTRRALGVRRIIDRSTGKKRSAGKSLLIQQKSIAFLIGRKIAKEGLPRSTGFKPSHRLFLFRDIQRNNPATISGYMKLLQLRVNQVLNSG
jgi:hypothetical protein